MFSLIFFISLNSNANIPRASVENLVQLNNSQIVQTLSGYKTYGVQFHTDVDGIVSMDPFDEMYNSDGYNQISYFPSILSLLESDPLQVLNDMGIRLNNNSSMSPTDMWRMIIDRDRTDDAAYTWKAKDDQICYKKIGRAGWDCSYFYVGGKEGNRKGYFSSAQSSDFYARVDVLVQKEFGEGYLSEYYNKYLHDFLKNTIAEHKILDAKNQPFIVIRDNKKAEQKRIEEENKKAKLAAEKKKVADLRARSRLSAQNNPGFRDLKPGLHYKDVLKLCPLKKIWNADVSEGESYSDWIRCYGIDNIKFKAYYTNDILDLLTLDMGPIVDGGYYLDIFSEGDSNIYTKMKKYLSDKYTLEYEYSERDRQLFNESEKTSLLHVYLKGQVALVITHKAKEYSNDVWLYVSYRDTHEGGLFLENYRPVRASGDDF